MKNEQAHLLYQEYDRLKSIVNYKYYTIQRVKEKLTDYIHNAYFYYPKNEIDSCYKELDSQRETLKELEKTLKTIKKLMRLSQNKD